MSSSHNFTIEQLAEAFQELSFPERAKLAALLPENWFENSNELSNPQKQALDLALDKENNGRALFHTWDEVENYVINRPNE
tara:strand:+ start:864 stop:1106 length:243 start_codon:yes stop_codon:yes gene_type:complete